MQSEIYAPAKEQAVLLAANPSVLPTLRLKAWPLSEQAKQHTVLTPVIPDPDRKQLL